MRFAVLADAHIGRSIPLAIGEHRRRAFSTAFSRAVDVIIDEGVDYAFICGDLFERRTLRPDLVQFAHDELYRLSRETESRHGKRLKVFVVRGNHDGRPQSDTLDYLKHPLAGYLVVLDEENTIYRDDRLQVVGLNYYDEIDRAFEGVVKPLLMGLGGFKVFMVHGFIAGYHDVPPYSSSLTIDQLSEANVSLALAGHYHGRCPPRKLKNGWLLTPGSLEMYDFAETPDKGFYIIDNVEADPVFKWFPIEPLHLMKQAKVESSKPQKPEWFEGRIIEASEEFAELLRRAKKPGYLRVSVRGRLSEGFPGDISLTELDRLRAREPLLLYVDIDTMELEVPTMAIRQDRELVDVEEFFSPFGEFAGEIKEMHGRIQEVLEEEASLQTGLLTSSQRASLLDEWVKRFEGTCFRSEAG